MIFAPKTPVKRREKGTTPLRKTHVLGMPSLDQSFGHLDLDDSPTSACTERSMLVLRNGIIVERNQSDDASQSSSVRGVPESPLWLSPSRKIRSKQASSDRMLQRLRNEDTNNNRMPSINLMDPDTFLILEDDSDDDEDSVVKSKR